MTNQEELEQALGRVKSILETGSLDERKQYKMQENFASFGSRLNAIESRISDLKPKNY